VPPPELTRQQDFEPPLALVEQVAFTARAMVEEFIAGLTAAGLACTELRVEVTGELDELVARTWLTPGVFEPAAVVDRIRWQLQAASGNQLTSAVTGIRLEPVAVDALANHVPGLFGSGTDERVHHVLSRVQGMLGHEGVLTPRIGGGRWLAERQVLVPWGDRPVPVNPAERPWPGSVPDPLPAAVFAAPQPVQVLSGEGQLVGVSDRGVLSGAPAELRVGDDRRTLLGWAGPWAIDERAWDPARHRSACRFQVVDDAGTAWLLVLQAGRWWAEARYD
jgi:protein ImuB